MTTRISGLPTRRTDVILIDEGQETVLAVPGGGGTHVLNPTARAIWELCDGRTLPDEMVTAVCDVFAVEPHQARTDVTRILDQLTELGLIVWSSNPRSFDP